MKTACYFIIYCVVLAGCSSSYSVTSETTKDTNITVATIFPAIPENWFTYTNEFLEYSFQYPQEAKIVEEGVTGFPSEELPPNMSIEEYFAYLKEEYPSHLCIRVHYKGLFISITPPEGKGRKYTGPCGISGIGNTYRFEKYNEEIFIAEEYRTIEWTKYIDKISGQWEHEASSIRISAFLFEFGNFTFGGEENITEEEYRQAKPELLLILGSFRWKKE